MRNLILTFIAFVFFFCSCKRTNKDNVLGPEIKAASPNFQLLDTLRANYFNGFKPAKSDSISFQYIEEVPKLPRLKPNTNIPDSIGLGVDRKPDSISAHINYYQRNVFFKAKFNEEVSWNLSLTKFNGGVLDNSVNRVILGTSSYLDSSNTSWDGKGNGSIFAKGDWVLAELKFVNGTSLIFRDTIYIATGELYIRSEATKLIDFEEGLSSFYTYTFTDDTDPKPSPLPYIVNTIDPPQGSKSLLVYGNDNNGDYFVGGMNKQKLDMETMKNYAPKDIYLNMYIYGYPTPNNLGINSKATKLNIGVSEDDINMDGNFDPLFEDTFEKQISVDWVGWKLISIRYGDLIRSASKANGGSGNGKLEPDKAWSVNCNLISSPNGNIVGANLDYLIITYGQPFDANNL